MLDDAAESLVGEESGPVSPTAVNGGDVLFWGQTPISKHYLDQRLDNAGWEGRLMLFVDAMFWHKRAFEATDRVAWKIATENLNKLAQGFFNHLQGDDSNEEEQVRAYTLLTPGGVPMGVSTPDDVDKQVSRWCGLLLGAQVRRVDVRVGEDADSKSKHGGAGYPFDEKRCDESRKEHLRRLKKVWKNKHFMNSFPSLFEKMGPQMQEKLLCSMCVEVPDDLLRGRQFHYYDYACPVKFARGNWNGESFVESEDSRDLVLPPKDVAAVNPERPSWGRLAWWRSTVYRSRVVTFYTEVPHVFGQWDTFFPPGGCCQAKLHPVRCSIAILASPHDRQQFKMPFAQALSQIQWDLVWPFFIVKCVLDVIFQALVLFYLTPMSHRASFEKLAQNKVPLCLIVYLGARAALVTLFEFSSLLVLYGGRREEAATLFGYFNANRIVNLCIDVYSLWLMCILAYDYLLSGISSSHVLGDYPFRLSALIFSKWCQLALQGMNMNMFLETLLPAWRAMTGKESMDFLFALLFLSAGTALAYYALPITTDLDDGFEWTDYAESVFRTARLNFMGDIEWDEFLGNKSIEGRRLKSNGGGHSAVTAGASGSHTYHWPLITFALLCGMLFPVIVLNLYVGVLGIAYEKAVESLLHYEGSLHAVTSARLLLPLRYYGRWLSRLRSCFESIWSEQSAVPEELPGIWIAIAEKRVRGYNSVDIGILDVSDVLTVMEANSNTSEELEVVEEQIESQTADLHKMQGQITKLQETVDKLMEELRRVSKDLQLAEPHQTLQADLDGNGELHTFRPTVDTKFRRPSTSPTRMKSPTAPSRSERMFRHDRKKDDNKIPKSQLR